MPKTTARRLTLSVAHALLLAAALSSPAARGQDAPSPMSSAAAAIGTGTDREILERFKLSREAPFTRAELDYYLKELSALPELAHTKIYSRTDEAALGARRSVAGVLKLYGREDDLEVVVIDQEAPFIGLYRECILIFSTSQLKMLSAAELRAAAAHELSHPFFVKEMREADRLGDTAKHHEIEHKCDLLAAIASRLLGDDPLSVAAAAELTENFYKSHTYDGLVTSEHPPAADRRHCLELFLSRSAAVAVK